MRFSRAIKAILAAATVAGVGLVAVPSAQAAAPVNCAAAVVLPPRVVVAAPIVYPAAAPKVLCDLASGSYIDFDLHSPRDLAAKGQFYYSAGVVHYLVTGLHADTLIPGVYTAVGLPSNPYRGAAGDSKTYNLVFTNSTNKIKFGGEGGISSSRSGTTVTVNGLFKEYRAAGYTIAAGRTEYLQRLNGSSWKTIASAPTNGAGRISLSFTAASSAQYRWASVENALTFDYLTTTTTR